LTGKQAMSKAYKAIAASVNQNQTPLLSVNSFAQLFTRTNDK